MQVDNTCVYDLYLSYTGLTDIPFCYEHLSVENQRDVLTGTGALRKLFRVRYFKRCEKQNLILKKLSKELKRCGELYWIFS